MFKSHSVFLGLGLVLSAMAWAGFGTISLAQTSAGDLQPWEGGGQTDNDSGLNDPFGSRNGGNPSSLFDLMNRIQLLNGRTSEQFSQEQDKNFESAVEEFQQKRQEAIQSETSQETPMLEPSPAPVAP